MSQSITNMKEKHPKSIKEPNPPPMPPHQLCYYSSSPWKSEGSSSQFCSEQRALGHVKLCSDRLSATLYTNFLHFTVTLTELKTIKYPDFYTCLENENWCWQLHVQVASAAAFDLQAIRGMVIWVFLWWLCLFLKRPVVGFLVYLFVCFTRPSGGRGRGKSKVYII